MSDNQSENSGEWSAPASNLGHLPPLEVIRDEQVMKIIRVVVTDSIHSHKVLNINLVTGDDHTVGDFPVYKVEDGRVRGLLPSKCWIVDTPDRLRIEMTFYACSGLPDRARPFGDGPTYVCAFAVHSDTVVEYPVELRMFIDHIVDNNGKCWYVFCFGQDVYDELIIGDSE
jgi:hypothetical protein